MKSPETTAVPSPPALLKTLISGFNAVTNHIVLILFPIGLDLLIWFGPRIKLEGIISRLVEEITLQSQLLASEAETAEMMQVAQEMWLLLGERLNLMVFLRSYPVGIPSIMTSILPIGTPLGDPVQVEFNSFLGNFGIVIFLSLLGLVLGTLFFTFVAQAAVSDHVSWRQGLLNWPWSSLQVIVLTIFLLAIILGLTIPASCAISLAALTNLAFGQCGILIYSGLLIWIIFPLLFSAHGIFVNHRKTWDSVKQGVLITRMTLPTTTLFFLLFFMLSQGFNYLWRIPPENSWLMLIGLAGHAFVATGLLSTSFVYYRDADRWVMSMRNHGTREKVDIKGENQQ